MEKKFSSVIRTDIPLGLGTTSVFVAILYERSVSLIKKKFVGSLTHWMLSTYAMERLKILTIVCLSKDFLIGLLDVGHDAVKNDGCVRKLSYARRTQLA